MDPCKLELNSEIINETKDLENSQKVMSETKSTSATLVEISVLFVQIGEIDTMNEKFYAEVRIESRWLYKDSNIDSSTIVYYDPNKNWNPKLYIENALSVKEDVKYNIIKSYEGYFVTETRYLNGSFWERLELQKFPLDIQELSLTITTKFSQDEVKLTSNINNLSSIDPEALCTFRDQQKWICLFFIFYLICISDRRLYEFVKVSETASYDTINSDRVTETESSKTVRTANNLFPLKDKKKAKKSYQSKFVASCFCSRKVGFYITNAYLLNFLITLISLTNFAIEIRRVQNRLSGTFTLILTSISFKWVTNRSLPTVSYMTSMDQYQIVNILYMGIECFWHAAVAVLFVEDVRDFYDRILLLVFIIIFIIIHIIFIVMFYRDLSKIKHLDELEVQFKKISSGTTFSV